MRLTTHVNLEPAKKYDLERKPTTSRIHKMDITDVRTLMNEGHGGEDRAWNTCYETI
jgi:hypothetical protein